MHLYKKGDVAHIVRSLATYSYTDSFDYYARVVRLKVHTTIDVVYNLMECIVFGHKIYMKLCKAGYKSNWEKALYNIRAHAFLPSFLSINTLVRIYVKLLLDHARPFWLVCKKYVIVAADWHWVHIRDIYLIGVFVMPPLSHLYMHLPLNHKQKC